MRVTRIGTIWAPRASLLRDRTEQFSGRSLSGGEANERPHSGANMNPVLDPTTNPSPISESSDAPKAAPIASEPQKPRRPRGFAAMDRTKVSEIASKGGKAAHAAGTAHQFSSDEARNAGRKGGVAPHVRRGRGPRNPNVSPPKSVEPKEGATE